MKQIIWTDEARIDYMNQSFWYFQRQQGLDERFEDAVRTCIEQIKARPDASPSKLKEKRRKRLPRPFGRFSIVYLVDPDSIVIVAVWEGHRNPDELLLR